MNKQLDELRQQLDDMDTQLLEILAKRLAVVVKIGKIKKANKIPPLDKSRWDIVLKTRSDRGEKLGLTRAFVKEIWDTIHKESLKKEEAV